MSYRYKPARDYHSIECTECGEEMDPEDLDDPGAQTSDPAFVHWRCLP